MAYGDGEDTSALPRQAGAYPGDLLSVLNKIDKRLNKHWKGAHKEMREAFDMVAGHQWPKEALEQFDMDGKWAVVFNRIDPMVSAISGAEITNRQTVKYSPRTLGDVKVNELYTGAVEWARQECCANDEESHAFRDAVIAGLGCTETRMDYLDDQEGMSRVDRVSPLEMFVDAKARKPNYRDARCLRRNRVYDEDEAKDLFPELYMHGSSPMDDISEPHHNEPGDAYDNARGDGSDAQLPEGAVEICEYQWFEIERVVRCVDPMTMKVVDLSPADYERKSRIALSMGFDLSGVPMRKKCFWRAFRAGSQCQAEKLPEQQFTYKFVTGKIDETKGTPYGVVRAMIDPQRWSNKAFVQMDRIVAANAKGGAILDKGAFEDHEQVEDDWARGGALHWANEGTVLTGAVMPKPVPPIPPGIQLLFQFVNGILPECVGVNKEMLGFVDRDQPAILEYQRKEAAYGVLSVFFDNLKNYRVNQGRLHLLLVHRYMTDGRVVRINGVEAGQERYVQLLPQFRDEETIKFDVIVDDAPTGPHQKERVWAMIQALPGMLQLFERLPPDVVLLILECSPLPQSFVERLHAAYIKHKQDPQKQQEQAIVKQIGMAKAQADVRKTMADASESEADAIKARAQADSEALDAEMKKRIAALTMAPANLPFPLGSGVASPFAQALAAFGPPGRLRAQ